MDILNGPDTGSLSAKALLATGQRIPGLGNGVLQDILFEAGVHPKKKLMNFTDEDRESLYEAIRTVLRHMAEQGGRDTEKDLFGNPGGYTTKLSKNTAGKPCPVCGSIIKKEAYLGGSIYICEMCQKL
jgi:formamidopyrimidine-DNA glycosylase